jgi:Zn-dependent protease
MKSSIKLGKLFKTHIRIHYTWILAFVLIAWAISTQLSTDSSLFLRITFGVATGVLFFFAILIRELILLLLAIYKGVVVEIVTVFAFGGLLQVDRETTTPSHELLLAVAGMLCNLVIAGVFFFIHVLLGTTDRIAIDVILKWLAFIFFTLSLFHIIPGFPLEGGRILHVILWKAIDNIQKATRIAGWTGWVIGLIVTVGGIAILILTVERFIGVFLIGIGLILQNAATHSLRQLNQVIRKQSQI